MARLAVTLFTLFCAGFSGSALAAPSPSPAPTAPGVDHYNAACKLAGSKQPDRAFAELEKAAQAGFIYVTVYENDHDFDPLHADPRWKKFLAELRARDFPCSADPRKRELDFWVGDWEVRSGPALVGHSSITKILGDCVILESWSGKMGHHGQSFNLFDAAAGKWKQTWVDDSGGIQEFVGGLDGKRMVYWLRSHDQKGSFTRRLSFTPLPDGRVRQWSERSIDGEKTFTTEYDFFYSRKR